jgi:hypothetical protein
MAPAEEAEIVETGGDENRSRAAGDELAGILVFDVIEDKEASFPRKGILDLGRGREYLFEV